MFYSQPSKIVHFKCIPWRLYHSSQLEQRHFVRHLPLGTCKWFQHCELLYFESITSCALENGHVDGINVERRFWMHTFFKKYRSLPETVWIISIALPFIFDIDLSYPYIKSFRSYPAIIGLQISAFCFILVADWLKLNFRLLLPVITTGCRNLPVYIRSW